MKRNSRRHSLRLSDYDYTTSGSYFVTICANKRTNLFGNIVNGTMQLNELGFIIQRTWLELPLHFQNLKLDAFIIMPNHFHGIIHLNEVVLETQSGIMNVGATHASPLQKATHTKGKLSSGSLGVIVGSFKSAASKRINKLYSFSGNPIWQRNYFEHVIRNESSLQKIREYVCQNPLRWHLDRENPERNGLDEFYSWIDKQGKNLRVIKKE